MGINNSLDLDLEAEYVLGILDYLSRPALEPYESPGEHTSGYGLKSIVHISLRQSEILLGVITDFFDDNGINYRFKRRNSEGIPTNIVVDEVESIINLNKIGRGTFIQIAERLEYLSAVSEEYEGKPISGNEERFYRLYKPWSEMSLNPDRGKYSLDFFETEFGITNLAEQFEAPSPTYPNSLSTAYVAGAFDAAGDLSLQIHEQSENQTGYGVSIIVTMGFSSPDIRVKPNFIRYFQRHNLEPSIRKRDNDGRLIIRFNTVENVESFIKIVGAETTYLYELCELFYGQLIPAYKDQYHTTKEGFIDMLEAFEAVADDRSRAKYTTEYFEKEWNL
jgi:hypothetical protein